MRPPALFFILLAGLLPLLAPGETLADRDSYIHRWASVEVIDRTSGYALSVYVHRGRLYVAGEPGHEYELRIGNRSNERLLAVTSVDGVNVITGQTADERQSGYVLDPWDGVDVTGWRKDLGEVATFYFTRLSNSYAARTGRPENVGVIGVALFRERQPCCRNQPAAPEAAQSADESASRRERGKLGTGHGERETSLAHYVDFERAATVPVETIAIYYDSKKNLLARGVIPKPDRPDRYADRPNPFPEGRFVPDP